MKRQLPNLLLALFLASATAGMAAEPPADAAAAAPADSKKPALHVGDAAPALKPGKWLKGEPVAKFEPGKIYIVEFWASWCGPCRASVPHLTKLQKQYPDITFIGMDGSEQEPTAAADFVKEMGEKMDYRVALDDDAHTAVKDWMEASNQDGIPCAFVVGKDSKIAWIGHPMQLDKILEQVVAGTFDAQKVAQETELAEKAAQAADEMLEKAAEKAVKDGDFTALDKAAKDHPDLANTVAQIKFEVSVEKKDFPTALGMAKDLVEKEKDNGELLNEIAWTLVDPEKPFEKPDLDLALKAAERSNELAKGEEPAVLDTLARVYYTRGDAAKAIELQTKAVSKAGDNDDLKDQLNKTLSKYKSGK